MAVAIQEPNTQSQAKAKAKQPQSPIYQFNSSLTPSLPSHKPISTPAQIARHSTLTYVSAVYAVVQECGIPSSPRTPASLGTYIAHPRRCIRVFASSGSTSGGAAKKYSMYAVQTSSSGQIILPYTTCRRAAGLLGDGTIWPVTRMSAVIGRFVPRCSTRLRSSFPGLGGLVALKECLPRRGFVLIVICDPQICAFASSSGVLVSEVSGADVDGLFGEAQAGVRW